MESIETILDEGKDLENFLWEMIKYVNDILMYKVSKKTGIYDEDEIKQISEISEKAPKEELVNLIYKLSELENKMKMSSQKTIIFETEIIKLCIKMDTEALEERISKLEKKISSGNMSIQENTYKAEQKTNIMQSNTVKVATLAENENTKNTETKQTKSVKKEPIKPVELIKGMPIDGWQNIVNNIKSQGKVMLYANLLGTEAVEINDMTVAIRFNNGLNKFREELLQKPENISILTKEISVLCGKPMQIKLEDASKQNTYAKQVTKEIKPEKIEEAKEPDILDDLDIEVNIVEEE